jgi:formylglycine-generating enzyme required for sulfatase activity
MTPRGVVTAALVCAGAAALLAGCPLGIDEGLLHKDASAADAMDGGPGSDVVPSADAGDASDAAMEAGCPPSMIQVPSPDAGPSFCIDSTEVTNKAYKMFLAAAEPPAAGSQIGACSWNTTYQPGGSFGPDDTAIGSIDWCDAYAFCQWAGKRLCGAIGGGSTSFHAYGVSPSTSQWFNACSAGGTLAFPYGNQYQPTWCNGAPLGSGGPVTVGSLPKCVGGYTGLHDMSGNVSELIDSCDTTPDPGCGTGDDCDFCLLVGGGFLSGDDGGYNIDCAYANQVYRKSQYVDNGLRCCSDFL